MRLVFGIGNPGPAYEPTRHNLGFRIVDRVADDCGVRFAPIPGVEALGAEVRLASRPALLVKPLTFVNRCGPALVALLDRERVALSDLLVVLDDFQLPVGRLRLRARGSSGGHNGLASILEVVESAEFARLRVGIGEPGPLSTRDFVLSRFRAAELPLVEEAIGRAGEGVVAWAQWGVDRAMTEVNRRDLDQPGNRA